MKFSILFTALTIFSGQALATCNTVMGGCTTEQAVNVAPHMRSETNKAAATTPNTSNPTVNKNIKNANATSPTTKPATKKM